MRLDLELSENAAEKAARLNVYREALKALPEKKERKKDGGQAKNL